MKALCLLLVTVCLFAFNFKKTPRVLVFTKTTAHRHSSIPAGLQAIITLGKENGFVVDTTEDAEKFTYKNLKKYDAVVFLITTGNNLLNAKQKEAFQKYIQSGGGFVGVHGASDAEYDWQWYGQLVGGRFEGHPPTQTAKVIVVDNSHPATKNLPPVWERTDEWYNFKNLSPDIHVLLKLDETSYKGGKHGNNHPIAWYHSFDGGRAFYTELGHTEESYTEPLFLQHLLGGIQYAMGFKK